MPFVEFPFCLKPVCQIVSVLAIASLPKLMRPLGDLVLATQVLVPMKNRLVFLLMLCLFHKFLLNSEWLSLSLCSFLPQRLQRAAPSDDLIEHFIEGLLMAGIRLEDAEVFKVGEHGEQDLVAHGGDLHLGQHQTQMLDRARPAGAAVADEASRLVVPLAEQKINRVLERSGDAMIILGRDEDIAVKRADLSGPYFGVRPIVLPHYGRHRLVEERQVEVFDVNKFKFGVAAILRDFANPFGHGLALAAGPRASNDNGNSKHNFLPCSFRYKYSILTVSRLRDSSFAG